jgi:hypothetical protein
VNTGLKPVGKLDLKPYHKLVVQEPSSTNPCSFADYNGCKTVVKSLPNLWKKVIIPIKDFS